jgi:PTH1 family peptidyl-tRNA hydrolase
MEARARRDGVVHFLQKPLTFMNLSGDAVDSLRVRQGFTREQVLIVCDDLDLPLGTIRIRKGGGHGGQKGLGSVLEALGTQQIARMRLGIGPKMGDAVDFVLAPFAEEEQSTAAEMFSRAADALLELMGANLEQVMNRYNQ